jgi:hypothetical protein
VRQGGLQHDDGEHYACQAEQAHELEATGTVQYRRNHWVHGGRAREVRTVVDWPTIVKPVEEVILAGVDVSCLVDEYGIVQAQTQNDVDRQNQDRRQPTDPAVGPLATPVLGQVVCHRLSPGRAYVAAGPDSAYAHVWLSSRAGGAIKFVCRFGVRR